MDLNKELNNIYDNYNVNKSDNNKFITYFINLYYLLKTRLFEIRESWLWYLIMICITPLSLMITFGLYFKGADTKFLEFIVSGNMIMGMVTGSMLTLGQNLGFLKAYKGFDYYAVLPIHKSAIIISYVINSTILTLPSTFIIYIVGNILFGLNFKINIIIIPIMFLGGLSLSGIGAIIGIYSKNMKMASLLTQIIQPLIVFMAPVMIPYDVLPLPLKYTSFLIPTKYIAEAFRQALNNKIDTYNIIILFIISVVSIYLVSCKLDWSKE